MENIERSILRIVFSVILIFSTTFAKAGEPCSLTVDIVGSGDVSQETIGYVDEDMRVEISPALDKVTLENSEIYAEYGPYVDGHSQFSIRKLLIKSAGNEDQVCPSSGCTRYNYIEADAGRGDLTDASVVFDGDDRKTIRLTWNRSGSPTDRIVHEVSIFPFGRFLKVDYLEARYQINIVDLGWPGGTGGGQHLAHGHEAWNADPGGGNGRGYITHQEPGFMGSYYNRYPADGVDDPDDGGDLNSHVYFIYGVYNPGNDRGFARTMKVEDVSIFKLLLDPDSRRGLETFPYPFVLPGTPEFTGYLHVATRGEEEILSTGMSLADGILPLELPPEPCGQEFRLTAVPDPGWEFAGWSGAVTGALNPASLVINDHVLVTATFTQPGHEFAEPDGGVEDGGGLDGGPVDADASGDLAGEDEEPPADAGDRADREPQESFEGGCSCATEETTSLFFLLAFAAVLALARRKIAMRS
jgi:MYXO-CTERM domain-containing protein